MTHEYTLTLKSTHLEFAFANADATALLLHASRRCKHL